MFLLSLKHFAVLVVLFEFANNRFRQMWGHLDISSWHVELVTTRPDKTEQDTDRKIDIEKKIDTFKKDGLYLSY